MTLALEGFARESVEEEAIRLGVPVQELVSFAVLYYLADVDSGRIARQVCRSPYPDSAPWISPVDYCGGLLRSVG